MAEYIEREAAVAAMNAEGYTKNMRVHKAILAIPAADVRPVVKAEWEFVDQEEPRTYGCSACKRLSKYPHPYCPSCGAKMEWRA